MPKSREAEMSPPPVPREDAAYCLGSSPSFQDSAHPGSSSCPWAPSDNLPSSQQIALFIICQLESVCVTWSQTIPKLEIVLFELVVARKLVGSMDTQGFSTRLFVGQPDFLDIPLKTKTHLFQARRLERVAVSFSRGIFPTQGWNPRLCKSRRILFHCTTWEAPNAHELPVYSLASLSLRLSPFVQHETEQNSETRAQNLASKSVLFYQSIERGRILKHSAAMLGSPSCPHRCGSGITHHLWLPHTSGQNVHVIHSTQGRPAHALRCTRWARRIRG